MNQSDKHKPNTVDEVVDEIIADLTLAEKGDIAFTGIDYCIISPYQAVIKLTLLSPYWPSSSQSLETF